MIYFDNSATTGFKPLQVRRAVDYALYGLSANPGRSSHKLSQKAAESVYNVRQKLSDFFGANGAEKVMFTLNCTHSLNCVIKGVLKRGDHAVISNMEHNAVLRPLVKTEIPYDVFSVDFKCDENTLANFKARLKPNTKLVVCTAASNVWGKILPISEIGKICKEKGILFAVDAAQGAGVIPINMEEMNIDYLCIAGHKGLYAPMGIGALICNKPIENTIIEGGSGTNSQDPFQPNDFPERLESGTVNLPGILGLGAGLDYVKNLGVNNIFKKENELINLIYNGLKNADGIELYFPRENTKNFVPVLAFNLEGLHSERVANILSENGFAVRGGLHCAPLAHKVFDTLNCGAVRVSVSTFNTKREAEAFLNLILLKKYKFY